MMHRPLCSCTCSPHTWQASKASQGSTVGVYPQKHTCPLRDLSAYIAYQHSFQLLTWHVTGCLCPALQIICITMMALALAEDSISKRERRDEIIDELGALPEKMKGFLKKQDVSMKQLAHQLKDCNSLLFFARGNNYATALEAALKVGHWDRMCA
eukprot:GHUV01023711.1.p2 GENE.GHUV01023711.1~~GHUV01023711.1.p2  ORF type:complete len:155 (+),score=37.91 GHUV01023711.1:739-1203(+)